MGQTQRERSVISPRLALTSLTVRHGTFTYLKLASSVTRTLLLHLRRTSPSPLLVRGRLSRSLSLPIYLETTPFRPPNQPQESLFLLMLGDSP